MKFRNLKPEQLITALPAVIILCLIFAASLNGRGRENTRFRNEVYKATDVLYGTCLRSFREDEFTVTEFRVDSILKGATEAETIFVYWGYKSGLPVYARNRKYLLVLDMYVNVYYTHDRYYEGYSTTVNRKSESKLTAEIENIRYNAEKLLLQLGPEETEPFHGTDYIHSVSTADIVDGSDYILLVKVDGKHEYEFKNSNLNDDYDCKVLDMLKGKVYWGSIVIRFFPGTVKIGEEYIIMLNGEHNSKQLSSKNSVYPPDKREYIEKLIEGSLESHEEP